MVNPISEAASAAVNVEVVNKNPKSTASSSGNAGQFEVIGQAAHKPDESFDSQQINKAGSENADQSLMKEAKGEIRKSEVRDGKVFIKVYDNSGKLLRKIPPGYLPLGEQKFDITV